MPTRTGYSFVGWSGKNLIGQCSKIQTETKLVATYNSNTNEITFASASDWAGNGYSSVQLDIYSNSMYKETLDAKNKIGELVEGSFTKSGTTNNQIRIKANGAVADSGIIFDMTSFPDGEYSVSIVIKERTESSKIKEYPYESFVVGDIQLECSSSPTTYESPRTVTSDTQKTSHQDEMLYAIWKKNLFIASNIVKYNYGCSWNDTTKTLTFADASSLDSRNSYNSFLAYQRVSLDSVPAGYKPVFIVKPLLDNGEVLSAQFTKESGYDYLEFRANGLYVDSALLFDISSFVNNADYIVRYRFTASVISTIDTSRYENFIVQDLEIFEA